MISHIIVIIYVTCPEICEKVWDVIKLLHLCCEQTTSFHCRQLSNNYVLIYVLACVIYSFCLSSTGATPPISVGNIEQ